MLRGLATEGLVLPDEVGLLAPGGRDGAVGGVRLRALALGLTLVPAGRIGDSVGRRRMFLAAVAAFAAASALTGAAPSAQLLIAARLI